ncbi:MAG: response regulator [Candidatus Paceibacterota bacterium]|jgi:DNA-binding response OmpR family regulator|nr:response regulator [Candidatus Paceibacterota bacterium]MDD5621241.1 response regulator [Candidatus Paceibacterota bacterium]
MKKILLIEDDPLLIDIYRTKLETAGFTVAIVNDGEKALEAVGLENPDAVLLDIVLPKVDGWEILKGIKEKDNKIKVIVLSNLGQKEEVEKGFNLGAEKYLIKANFTPSDVVAEIEKLFI